MVVLSFTGPAIADAQPLARVAQVVARQAGPCVVVVAGLAGIPERLDQTMGFAREGRVRAARALMARIVERHRALVLSAAPKGAADVLAAIDRVQSDLERFITGIAEAGEAPDELRGAVHAAAGLLSSAVVAAVLQQAGLPAVRLELPAPANTRSGGQLSEIERQIRPVLGSGAVPVVAGGVASGEATNSVAAGIAGALNRAAVLAGALDARELQLWTIADGVPAADPAVVPGAHSVAQLSFAEAIELARAGAKDLHAASLELAAATRTPVLIRSTRRPDAPGTTINGAPSIDRRSPAAVASRRVPVVLRISARDTRTPALVRRILDLSRDRGNDTPFVAPVSASSVIAALERAGSDDVVAAVKQFADVTALDDMTLVSAVGEGLAADPEVAAGVLSAVAHVTVHAHVRHPSGRSITMLLDDADATEAVQRVYERFFGAPAGSDGARLAGRCEA